jgi:hypothetical protein
MDEFSEAFYFLADQPPPPFNSIVTQRDFVMQRHLSVNSITGRHSMVYRNGIHSSVPETKDFIRGSTVGVIGFAVERVSPSSCFVLFATAAELKGSIPSFLVNFVAKVTSSSSSPILRLRFATPLSHFEKVLDLLNSFLLCLFLPLTSFSVHQSSGSSAFGKGSSS